MAPQGGHWLWVAGPKKGEIEYLTEIWDGYQRREVDGSLTLLPRGTPVRLLSQFEYLTLATTT